MTTTPPAPRRVRTVGNTIPDGAVNVDNPTVWGNPFTPGAKITDPVYTGMLLDGRSVARDGVVEDADHATLLYSMYVLVMVPFTAAQVQAELAGKDLACSCPLTDEAGNPHPCHADTLLLLANSDLLTQEQVTAAAHVRILTGPGR